MSQSFAVIAQVETEETNTGILCHAHVPPSNKWKPYSQNQEAIFSHISILLG